MGAAVLAAPFPSRAGRDCEDGNTDSPPAGCIPQAAGRRGVSGVPPLSLRSEGGVPSAPPRGGRGGGVRGGRGGQRYFYLFIFYLGLL